MPYKYRTKVLSYLTDKGYSQYNEREYTECPHCGVRCRTLGKHRRKCHPEKVHRY